ncbi:Peptidase A1 [Macleaya cordata]|uniref:Peptidase A1 n=1 Tax=Macleaya cordata TaxID=56857 RepID=A0A200Q459_MACCD|nr:Peptidase A1 [Macleaya cordata]
MAEAKHLLPLMFSLLLLFNIGIEEVQCLKEKKVFSLQKLQWRKLSHTPTCHPQKSRREKGAIILEMKHHDSCSGQTKNWDEEVQSRLISDNSRVQFLQSKIKKQVPGKIAYKSDTQIPLYSGVKLLTLNYIVTLQLGRRNMTVIVDTGSDVTWVQCAPCKFCYSQQDPLLNPGLSRSYKSVLCNSSTCQSLQAATGFSGVCGTDQKTCNYMVSYGDGSYTRGELGRERLYLGKTYVNDFIFGCGRNNKGLFGGASGLMGLGRSNLSLISQTIKKFDGVFSYCLPSTNADSSGSLTFGRGSSVYKNFTPISYTNMVPNPQLSTFYFLNLTGISIGGVAIQAPGFAKGRTLIDSGTVITRLVPSVYNALKTEFLKQFSGYPPAPSYSILDTCFNLTAYEEVNIPTLKLQFEDVVGVNVDVNGMFYFAKTDASQVCLALASLSSEDDIGIIGNFQQRNLRVVYDTKKSKVGFAEETCSYT